MVISFTRISSWLRGRKEGQPVSKSTTTTLNASSELDFALTKRESKKLHKVEKTKIVPSHKKVHQEWKNREKNRIDREFDIVVVPSDGGECLSGSESDDSGYSVGWTEPHGPSFQSDGESDDSYGVLVPCYKQVGKRVESSNNEILNAFKNLPDEFSSDSKKYMEQWLDSLKNL